MEKKKKPNIVLRILVAIPCTFLAIIILLNIVCPFINNAVAKDIVKEMKEKPLPDKTIVVEQKSLAGHMSGNGNGMQYFGALLLKSDLSLEELQAYYSKFSENEWAYVVKEQSDSEIKEITNWTAKFETSIDSDDYYILYTWGDYNGFASEFDLRGH